MNICHRFRPFRLAVLASLLVLCTLSNVHAQPSNWILYNYSVVKADAIRGGVLGTYQDTHFGTNVPTSPNTWESFTTAESIAFGPYQYGARTVAAQYAAQYPTRLFITDRNNVHAWAQDDDTFGQSGQSTSDATCSFTCSEYSYLQFSKQYYGYKELIGVNHLESSWGRNAKLDGDLLWQFTGRTASNQYLYSFVAPRYLISPGAHTVESRLRVVAQGILSFFIITPGDVWHQHETYNNVSNSNLLESAWWVDVVPNETQVPGAIQVLQGTPWSGNLASLGASDDNHLQIQATDANPIATLQFRINFLQAVPDLALRVYIEAKVDRPRLTQTVSLLNRQSGLYDTIHTQAATETDSVAYFRTEELARYMDNSGQVFGRISWSPSPRDRRFGSWLCSVDEIKLMGFRR